MIADIGGTTTTSRAAKRHAAVRADGATVGGHRTMVEAVLMHTHGLGGDSETLTVLSGPSSRSVLGGSCRSA